MALSLEVKDLGSKKVIVKIFLSDAFEKLNSTHIVWFWLFRLS